MSHSELIARLQRIADWFDLHDEFSFSEEPATIREAADALQSLERVPMTLDAKEFVHLKLQRRNFPVSFADFDEYVRVIEAHHGITPPESI